MTAGELTTWRKAAGYTQPAAAAAIGIALSTLRAIEQGPPAAPVRRVIALAVRALQHSLKP